MSRQVSLTVQQGPRVARLGLLLALCAWTALAWAQTTLRTPPTDGPPCTENDWPAAGGGTSNDPPSGRTGNAAGPAAGTDGTKPDNRKRHERESDSDEYNNDAPGRNGDTARDGQR